MARVRTTTSTGATAASGATTRARRSSTGTTPRSGSSVRRRNRDVHREVDQPGLDFAVAVMTEVDRGHANAIIRARRFQITRAPTHVIAKIAAMP